MVGTNFIDDTGDRYNPDIYVIHEEFYDILHNDIALIRTEKSIIVNELVSTIDLPEKNEIDYKLPAYLAGWGALKVLNY